MIEIKASFSRGFQLFVIVMMLATLAGVATVLSWSNPEANAVLLGVVIFVLCILLFITYKMLSRPVMFRLDENGMFIRRLGTTVPWEALDRVERFEYRGNRLFSLIETDSGHEVFQHKRIQSGRDVNQRLGLPPLVISMKGMQMSDDEFAELLRNSDEVVRFIDVGI